MNVAFINPPWFTQGESTNDPEKPDEFVLRGGIRAGSRWPFSRNSPYRPDEFKFGSYLPFPMFLGAAAAYARRECPNDTIVIRDSIARGESYATFFKWLTAFKPDAIVIETGAASWQHDRKMLASFKRVWPALRIAVAGPTARSGSATDPGGVVDAWILGEFEKGSVDFIRGYNGVIPFNLLTEEELAKAPFPLFDEEVWWHYADANPKGTKFPELTVWSSRSCSFRCSFCAWPATMTNDDPDGTGKRAFRYVAPEWVEAFIRERMAVAERDGKPLQCVRLDDDTMNGGNRHTLAICEVMKRIGLPWSAMCRADMVSRETWQAMKDAGCFGVKLGIESGSQRVVDEIVGKKLDIVKAVETARWLRSIGMTVHLTFTVGLPGELPAEQQETLDFIQMCYATGACDTHQLSGTAVIEGTPLHTLESAGHLSRYPGAKIDANYESSPDGNKKIEGMTK